jgi:RNA polymerase sigma factor (TIGR02999 family)
VLSAIEGGDPRAAAQLLGLVYDELRKLAAQKLAHEKPGQTLQATALVHEAYLRLVGEPATSTAGSQEWRSRGHFFAAAAEAMRRILVENARRKHRFKHGGDRKRVDLEKALPVADAREENLLSLDDVLSSLESIDPLAAQLVKLRYFVGMTIPEAAAALGISLRNPERNRGQLGRHLHDGIHQWRLCIQLHGRLRSDAQLDDVNRDGVPVAADAALTTPWVGPAGQAVPMRKVA